MLAEPFRHGHMRHRHGCVTCGRSTRRTVRLPGRSRGRYVLCTGCELPSPEERLLMAIYGVDTLPELAAAAR